MAVWIVTTGNSDVQLNTNDNWYDLYPNVRNHEPIQNCDEFGDLGDADEKTGLYSAPARVLGLVCSNQKEYYSDLCFPLLEVFCKFFKSQQNQLEFPKKIIVILTDQSQIFSEEEIAYKDCPFWQDTVTLKPLFQWYLQEQLGIEPEFLYIQPKSALNKGIDHWNEMLTQVENTVEEELSGLDLQPNEFVYVSHQAGTPAISSAVQFISVSQFDNVQFLSSNQFYNYDREEWQYEPELIPSSSYGRGLQIQKAKSLLTDGFPGAAAELVRGSVEVEKLREIEEWRDRFNIKPTVKDRVSEEFQIQNAGQRVRTALDLIEIFFKQENYLQGITLLAAAQETFMKAAVLKELGQKFPVIGRVDGKDYNFSPLEILQWTNQGLFFLNDRKAEGEEKKQNNNTMNQFLQIDYRAYVDKKDFFKELRTTQLKILERLKFPVKEADYNLDLWNKINYLKNLKCTNSNNALLKWIKNLEPQFRAWALLDWIGEYEREFEDDRRNQLMHNLRGVEKKDVLAYLYGKPDGKDTMDESLCVREVYRTEIKEPFVKALCDFGLCGERDEKNFVEEALQKLANSLR